MVQARCRPSAAPPVTVQASCPHQAPGAWCAPALNALWLTSEIKGVSAGHTGSRWCQVVLRANWGKKSTSAQHLSAQCRWICGTAVPSAGPVSLNLWHCSAPVPASVARSVALQCPVSRRAGRPAVPAPGRVALSASWVVGHPHPLTRTPFSHMCESVSSCDSGSKMVMRDV